MCEQLDKTGKCILFEIMVCIVTSAELQLFLAYYIHALSSAIKAIISLV